MGYKLRRHQGGIRSNMNSQLVVLVALAFAHSAVALDLVPMKYHGLAPSTGQRSFGGIMDLVTGGMKPSPHIVGGNEAKPHSHPHQVALICRTADDQTALCGGSLLTPEWVLTAAHCTDNIKAIVALLGAHDLTKQEPERQQIPVMNFATYSWNSENIVNDIALLKLAKPATLNQWVQTIRLPPASMKGKDISKTTVGMTGWGRYSDASEDISPVLREVETTVMANRLCGMHYGAQLPSTMICADGSQLKGVCGGDSGGPMVMTEADGLKTVIGATSFGSVEGCEKKWPTVFTRVDEYLEWISAHTGLAIRQN